MMPRRRLASLLYSRARWVYAPLCKGLTGKRDVAGLSAGISIKISSTENVYIYAYINAIG